MNCIHSLFSLARPAVVVALAVAGMGSAQATLVGSRGALGATDSITWGQLGADGASVATPASVTSTLGAGATVQGSGLFRFDEGGGTLAANFALGDQLLSNFGTDGSISIVFNTAVSAVGAQLASIDWGVFSGLIEVFDASNVPLESYLVGGSSSNDQDNSALFLGVSRATADIARVVFSVQGTDQGHLDFALNQLSFGTRTTGGGGGGGGTVPEPASALLAAAGLVGLARRKRASH